MRPERSSWARPLLIVGVAVVCVAVLIGLVVREAYQRSHGTPVTLAMVGVDPRDLVRGHYVAVRLSDDLPAGRDCPPPRGGDWVALQRTGARYLPVGQFDSREQAQRGGAVAVRGTMTCRGSTVGLDIGVDRFYINQRDAQTIERALLSGRRAQALVSVGSDGRARLVGLDVDGQRYNLNW